MQTPRLVTIEPIQMVGLEIETTLDPGPTRAMWARFRPRCKEIPHRKDDNFYSVQVYPPGMKMEAFGPATVFQRRAAVAVHDCGAIPEGMQAFVQPGGLYTVWLYRGRAQDFGEFGRYIFGEWIPRSGYEVDDRPHFEVLGADYRLDDAGAEEEIWVPVRDLAL